MSKDTWAIWWGFRWEEGVMKWIVVRTDHPNYKHVDYICKFPIENYEDVHDWEQTWFDQFHSEIMSGRQSLHKVMKALGHEKK